ncbi:MAG TPA: restriction endonuclease [Puia sp.]|nr:restriction endonuclease [Puia sp.]
MKQLDFNEIKDGHRFEELVAEFFRSLGDLGSKVNLVGVGPDGGKDILYEFQIPDLIKGGTRRWVIQCKFHRRNISVPDLGGISIKDLIVSHDACGYLLICRERPTSGLSEHFEKLAKSCRDRYLYEIWTGEQFKQKLLLAPETLHQQFFPEYFDYLLSKPQKSQQ